VLKTPFETPKSGPSPEAGTGEVADSPLQRASLRESSPEARRLELSGITTGAPEVVEKASIAAPEAKEKGAPPAKASERSEGSSSRVSKQVGDDARKGIEPILVSLLDPNGMEAELFRLLRARILFPQTSEPPRTILVTSALAEEGKSFVAANLAISMARHVDQHVLLVDCDLRKPTIHSKFGLQGCKGLSEYLSTGQETPTLLVKTGVEKLKLLPSGAPPPNPSELVTSSKMSALIQELKARYDDRYIIIDSPPAMMAPETSAIAKWVDGILLVVKYGFTPMYAVEELVTQLDREKIIGAVINKFSLREFQHYSYNKYYGYSYGKYKKDGRRHTA
jgi:protein-tyrosine kinase